MTSVLYSFIRPKLVFHRFSRRTVSLRTTGGNVWDTLIPARSPPSSPGEVPDRGSKLHGFTWSRLVDPRTKSPGSVGSPVVLLSPQTTHNSTHRFLSKCCRRGVRHPSHFPRVTDLSVGSCRRHPHGGGGGAEPSSLSRLRLRSLDDSLPEPPPCVGGGDNRSTLLHRLR